MKVGMVVIGRNEGRRLSVCLDSLPSGAAIVYVDSGSTDDSLQRAQKYQVEILELTTSAPFTAARARNAGYERLRALYPSIQYVQFVDADCELSADWLANASTFLDLRTDVGAVSGNLHERYPERSVYNWLCDLEWQGAPGELRACGGVVMLRADALQTTGGYREDLIAGEEPELCVRLRGAGWRIWRLDTDMAVHDANLFRFGQWWRRTMRGGYAYAHGAYLHGSGPDRHFLWESRRAWLWGFWLPLGCLAMALVVPGGWVGSLIYPAQLLRLSARRDGSASQRLKLAFFQVLARFPEAWGQIRFMHDRLLGRQARLIEHK
jgi:glycosyltransferase involved in cell wall biosynthesis